MDLDTIIYAVIAVVLLSRLWFVFGRRNDEDKRRPNPFIAPVVWPQKDAPPQNVSDQQVTKELPALLQPLKAAPASLAGGLEQIKSRDAAFDEREFLRQSRLTFTMIVEDYAKGDMSRITRLLTPSVLAHFQKALDIRRAAGQVGESKIVNIKDIETAAARMENDQASIKVRFVSDQENILRDSAGQIIGGEAGKIEEITDLWTFTRDMTAPDTTWLLAETSS